jgi:hypothetical protein
MSSIDSTQEKGKGKKALKEPNQPPLSEVLDIDVSALPKRKTSEDIEKGDLTEEVSDNEKSSKKIKGSIFETEPNSIEDDFITPSEPSKKYKCFWRISAQCKVEADTLEEIKEHQRIAHPTVYVCEYCLPPQPRYQHRRCLEAHQMNDCKHTPETVKNTLKATKEKTAKKNPKRPVADANDTCCRRL